jgi:hypothetical protein
VRFALQKVDDLVVLYVVDENGRATGACNVLTMTPDGTFYRNEGCDVPGLLKNEKGRIQLKEP